MLIVFYTPALDNYLPSLLPGVKNVDKANKFLQDRVLDSMGPVAMLFEHIYSFLAEAKPDENVILSYEQMKDLGVITSNAIYVYWVMPLHFCLRSDVRLSLTKSIPRELYHLLPQKSFCKLAKVCLGKDLKQGSRPDQKQQRPYFQLVLWGKIHDLLSFFEAAPPPSEDEGTVGVVPVSKCQQLQPVSRFIQRPRQSCQGSPAVNPSSHPVERPSHLPPGMMLHLNPLAINHLPLAGHLKHCISNWEIISKDPWVLETVQGFHLDLISTPHQLSVLLTVSHSEENMALIDIEIQHMLEKEAIHVVPRKSYIKGL